MGVWFVAITVWLALWGYAMGVFCQVHPNASLWRDRARLAWTFGSTLFVIHVFAAFHVYHQWSHQAAMEHVAQETARVMGRAMGQGIFVSYAYTLIWALDAIWWWAAGHQRYFNNVQSLQKLKHAFMFFIFVNGTIVFEAWRVKIFGALVLLALLWAYLKRRQAT
jgi:hypothetical protein